MRTFKYSLLGLSSAMLFFACGDDVTKVTEVTQETSGLEVVASADSLGKCTAENVGEMKFAQKERAVYVCADSAWQNVSAAGKDGEKGEAGKDGSSCAVESLADSSGYKIVCGSDSVGVILNGEKGEAGKDGASCSVEPLADSSGYKVVCGSDSVGVILNGIDGKDDESSCRFAEDKDGVVKFVCGKADTVTWYKSLCGGKPFDPAKSFCLADSVISLCGGETYEPSKSFCAEDSIYTLCGGVKYDPSESFCFKKPIFLRDTIYTRCGGNIYNPEGSFCFEDSVYANCSGMRYPPDTIFCYNDRWFYLCGGKSYNPDESFCFEDSAYALCGGNKFNPTESVCHNERLYGFFEDARDGQVYRTIKIGEQTWMAQNLNYVYTQKAYDDGALDMCYDNDPENCKKYGRLYTWGAAMDSAAVFSEDGKGCGNYTQPWSCNSSDTVRGVCPEGWHLPTYVEWGNLNVFIAAQHGGEQYVPEALKSRSGWADDKNGSDEYGFEALPAGYCMDQTDCQDSGVSIIFISSSVSTVDKFKGRYLATFESSFYQQNEPKEYFFSVRCIKN